ncbi:MAG: ABC transporter substrate-binding protein [Candidatus Thorarchaeota archaeon]
MSQSRAIFGVFFLLNALMATTIISIADAAIEQPPPLFKLTLSVPTNNYARWQHAGVISGELRKIGIQAELAGAGWESLIPHLYERPSFGSYNENGFDIAFIDLPTDSRSPGILRQLFHSSNINPPSRSYNCFPINNSVLNTLLDQILVESNVEKRREYVLQALNITVWEDHPVMGIYQAANVFAVDADLRGFDAFRWGQPYPRPQELYYENTSQTTFKYAISAPFSNLNPALSNTYYDRLIHYPIQAWTYEYDANMSLKPVLATSHPIALGSNEKISSLINLSTISNDSPYANTTASSTWGPNPNVNAANYNPYKNSSDNSMFLINLRKNIPWQSGWGYEPGDRHVTVEDFQWTLGYWTEPALASPLREAFAAIYGINPAIAIQKLNDTMFKLNLRGPWGSGQVADWFDACALFPLPRHILDPSFDATPYGGGIGVTPDNTTILSYANHTDYAFNTGEKPVLGAGPYYFESWDDVEAVATLRKFDEWGGEWSSESSLWDNPAYSDNNIDTYAVTIYPSKESAAIALEDGAIDGIDAQFPMGPDIPYLQTKPNIQVLLAEGGNIQAMVYNTKLPALSDRYVRLAISHMIPAQKIVDFILGGLGSVNELVGIALANPYMPKEEEFKTLGLDVSENVVDPYTGEPLKFQGHIRYDLLKAWALMEKAGYDMSPWRGPPPRTTYVEGHNPLPQVPVILALVVLGALQILLFNGHSSKKRIPKKVGKD